MVERGSKPGTFSGKRIDVSLACDADLNKVWRACVEEENPTKLPPSKRVGLREALINGISRPKTWEDEIPLPKN